MKTDRRENNIIKCKTKIQFCQTNGASAQVRKNMRFQEMYLAFRITRQPLSARQAPQHGANGRTINSLACLLGEQYYLSLLLRRTIYKDKVKYLTDEFSGKNINAEILSRSRIPTIAALGKMACKFRSFFCFLFFLFPV